MADSFQNYGTCVDSSGSVPANGGQVNSTEVWEKAAIFGPPVDASSRLEQFAKSAATLQQRIANARKRTNTNPTDTQIENDSYAKGRIKFQGLEVRIENPKGSTRSGVGPDGKKWSSTMTADYGEIVDTAGADDDPVDIFIGDTPESEYVLVVNQVSPDTKKFDEHKIICGCINKSEAEKLYLSNYEKGWKGLGSSRSMTMEQFREWLAGDTTKKASFEEFKRDLARKPKSEGYDKLPKAKFEENVSYEPICPHCDKVMWEKHFVPDRDMPEAWRHRGDCYDLGAFAIEWPGD